MSSEFEKNLDKYADVIIKVGLNLQPGQRLLIGAPLLSETYAPIELAPLVRLIVAKAYKLGARFVDVMWIDNHLQLLRYKYAPNDSFEEFPSWRTDLAQNMGKSGDAILIIYAENPDLLINEDPELIHTSQQIFLKHVAPIWDLVVQNTMNWAVITVPADGWAEKVFPDFPPDKRTAKLWEAIFEICRIKYDDPILAWQDHINQLATRSKYLNQKQYIALKLEAPGTDLKIGLPKNHIWLSGSMTSQNNIDFTGNIPTEEIYTLPHKDMTEGTIKMTKPLNHKGYLIEDIKMTFSKGKVIELNASKGKDFLGKIIETDEGASQLGEIALVPHSSPISQSGLLFYNSLIDENASNHIALGFAFRPSLKKSKEMSDEEFMAAGGNISLSHIDFMIGSGEMNIDGITEDGTAEPIMRKGEWAFEV